MVFKKDAIIKSIVHIVFFDLTSKVGVDHAPTLGVLFFHSVQERKWNHHDSAVPQSRMTQVMYTYRRYGSLNV